MAWTKPDFLFFNGTNVFMYPGGPAARVFAPPSTVHTEPEWHIATGMARAPSASARTFAAANYHDLVDMPFFVGRFDLDSARDRPDKWVRLATYPAGIDRRRGARRRRGSSSSA